MAPLSEQARWFVENWADLTGETRSSFFLAAALPADTGEDRVRISVNGAEWWTSAAMLTVD